MTDEQLSKFKKLEERVSEFHLLGAYHKKRGFSLSQSKLTTASNHLIEEVVELQAEVLDGTYDTKREEGADVLLVFLSLLWISNMSFSEIVDVASKKIEKNFTLNKDEVLTNNPGFTRKNRESVS